MFSVADVLLLEEFVDSYLALLLDKVLFLSKIRNFLIQPGFLFSVVVNSSIDHLGHEIERLVVLLRLLILCHSKGLEPFLSQTIVFCLKLLVSSMEI